jgi:hypothetical protein
MGDGLSTNVDLVAMTAAAVSSRKWCPAANRSTSDRPPVRKEKRPTLSLYRLDKSTSLQISIHGTSLLPGKVFIKGIMPSCRIQHVTHLLGTVFRFAKLGSIERAKNTNNKKIR